MTSSLRWNVVRSIHSFFLTYLLLSTLSIIPSFSLVFKIGLVLMVFLLLGSHPISHLALRQSQSMIPSQYSLLFPVVYPKVPYLAHYFLLSILLLFARWCQTIPSNIICKLMTPSCTSLSLIQHSALSLDTLTTTFSDILSWMNLNKLLLNKSKIWILLIGTKQQRLKFSDLTDLSLSNDIVPVSSSARNLGFIFDSEMSFSDQIGNLYPNLVIFISETSVEFVIFFHFQQLGTVANVHLSPANLTTVIHYTLASHKSISTNFNAFKTHWHASSQTPQKTNTWHQVLKNLHWLAIKQRIDYNTLSSGIQNHLQINNQHIFTIVLHFLHMLFLHECPHSLELSIPHVRSSLGKRTFSVIGPRLWNSLPPDTRNSSSWPVLRSRLKTAPLQNCVPSRGSIASPWTVYPDFDSCYSHFMPYRMTPNVRHRAVEVYYDYYYCYVKHFSNSMSHTGESQVKRCIVYASCWNT